MEEFVYETTIDYTEYLLQIIENQEVLIDIQKTHLGYLEFITYIVIPLFFLVSALWWFFKQFITQYQ